MKKPIFRSIGAILAGFASGAILSIATDKVLESAGLIKTEPFDANPDWLIMLVISYRTIYNAIGAYIAARLAPNRPMRHAMLLGTIGLIASIVGTIVMWHVPPHWYPITLIILTLPAAWLGGRLAIKNSPGRAGVTITN